MRAHLIRGARSTAAPQRPTTEKTSMTKATFDRFRAFITRNRLARVLVVGFVLALAPGCDEEGAEGDRCNPYLSHNDCNSGLTCAGHAPSTVIIPFCQENYCCPVDSNGDIVSSNPNCQPGCNGSAAVLCALTADPGACLLADGGSLDAALALDETDSSSASSPTTDAAATDAAAPDSSSESSDSGDAATSDSAASGDASDASPDSGDATTN
jgi:hypothetical protein